MRSRTTCVFARIRPTDVNDRDRLGDSAGNIDFSEGGCVSASVRLFRGSAPFQNLHAVQINDTNLLFAPIRGINLAQIRNIHETCNSGYAGD